MLADLTIFPTLSVALVAMVSVALVGLSKGGLGGAFALMGVPILSLVMPPTQAAALLLPILLMMDAQSLWLWRGYRDWEILSRMIPAACIGIAIGWALAAYVSDAAVRLIVGTLALSFAARAVFARMGGRAVRYNRNMAWVWGPVAGFTSFVAHAGGPPFQVQVLPKGLSPRHYTGTSVVFFAVINAIKVVPYAALGLFDQATLVSGLIMLPVVLVSVWAGAMIIRRMSAEVFYPFTYTMVSLVGIKLIYDGIAGL